MMSSDARKAAFFRLMFVACEISTTGIAIWRWLFGIHRTSWGQLLADVIALSVLITVWYIITYFNLATAALMKREAAARNAKKK